jgi:hypothetical protein
MNAAITGSPTKHFDAIIIGTGVMHIHPTVAEYLPIILAKPEPFA